jgi:hypothetical protein
MKTILSKILISAFLLTSIVTKVAKISINRQTRGEKPERKLLFGFGEVEQKLKEQQETNQHENMVMMMKMMERQGQIKKILDLVGQFNSRLDDLSESVNTEIVQLSAVANSNMNRPEYLKGN